MTVGERLREARESLEMTIGDISRRTFIQPRFLQAIEEDDLASIPNPQRRFFVRDYARVVGLDPEELLSALPDTPQPPSTTPDLTIAMRAARENPPDTERRRRDRFKPMAFGDARRRNTSIVNWIIVAALILLMVAGGYFLFTDGMLDDDATTAGEGEPRDSSFTPTEIISAPEGGGDTAAVPEVRGEGDSLTLVGTAVAQVWFSIVMDGQKSETGTLDSGAVKTWRAMETFKISLGNAGGLELALNEKGLGALGPKRTIIRNQIIDENGIRTSATRRPASGAGQNGAPAARESSATRSTRPPNPTRTAPRQTTPRQTTPRQTTPRQTAPRQTTPRQQVTPRQGTERGTP